MRLKQFCFILVSFAFKTSVGQTYFDFYSTNIPKSKFDNFSLAHSDGLGWLQTGNYTSPEGCSNCSDYSKDSKLKKDRLDSLVLQYKQSGLSKIYSSKYVPNNSYFVTDKKNIQPYIIKTLYKIEGDKPIAIHQIKMTFYERPNKNPGISTIEIFDTQDMKAFDPIIVMKTYKQKVKDDVNEPAPKIEN